MPGLTCELSLWWYFYSRETFGTFSDPFCFVINRKLTCGIKKQSAKFGRWKWLWSTIFKHKIKNQRISSMTHTVWVIMYESLFMIPGQKAKIINNTAVAILIIRGRGTGTAVLGRRRTPDGEGRRTEDFLRLRPPQGRIWTWTLRIFPKRTKADGERTSFVRFKDGFGRRTGKIS